MTIEPATRDEAAAATPPAVRFTGVTRRFPGVLALDDVTLEIRAGSCHALCGENGAGKSTLGRILAGIHAPDAGSIEIHGRAMHFGGPRDALAAGVGMVHQELAFCENLSVAENLCLADLPSRGGFVARAGMARRAEAMLAEIGASLNVQRPLGELTIGQQQQVQIASAVGSGASIIVFDEPTSSLGQAEADRLYDLIRRLRERGVTCIYVSHRMPEIFALCDAVSVLRDGKHVATRELAGLSEAELVRMMIGRTLDEYFPTHIDAPRGREVLRVEKLSVPGVLDDVSFTLHQGEIVGLAGLVGAGRSELAATLFGLMPGFTGSVTAFGRRAHARSPREAIRAGIGLVPEDRKKQGLVLSESGVHNTTHPILDRLSRLTWIQRRRERAIAREWFDKLRVRTPGLDAPAAGLSGGNQQKIVLAKWLAANVGILILDEPTRGVDVGAKAEIHALIDVLAAQGKAILLISSELPEILGLSSRILVLRAGRIVGRLARQDASQDGLLKLMAGIEGENRD